MIFKQKRIQQSENVSPVHPVIHTKVEFEVDHHGGHPNHYLPFYCNVMQYCTGYN